VGNLLQRLLGQFWEWLLLVCFLLELLEVYW
jgi:hypothetical protein